MSTNKKTPENKPRTKFNQNMVNRGISIPAGIYLGEVTANNDPDYPGARVKVHIFSILPAILPAEENPGTEQALGSIWCQRMTPFAANSGDYSYGMMGPPPEIGNTVVVAYSGDYASGIILGVLPDLQKREGLQTGGSPRGKTNDGVVAASEPNRAGDRKPDPIASADKAKAALKTDDLRNPSQVFNHKNISMNTEDGNYVTVSPGTGEDGAGGGVRMGTGRGAQLMMDNKTDTIFMNNASSDYISIDTNGNIDLYCSGMFSIHAVGGINFHTGNSFNVQSDSGINMKSNSPIKMQSAGGGIDLSAQTGIKLTATGGKLEVSSSGDIVLKSGGNVHLNGPAANPAETPSVAAQPGNSAVTESVSGRVPGPLPWSGLNPYNQGAVQGRGGSGGGGGGGVSGGGGGGGGGGYSTAPGAYVDPNNVGNFYPAIPPDASDNIEWADGADRRISRKLFDAVANVASSAGIRFKIMEGLVLPANAGGLNAADTSLHAKGEAVDVVLIGGGSSVMTKTTVDKIIRLAKENGIGGIGAYNGKVQSAGFVDEFHFDLGRPRMWGQCPDNSLSYECLPTFVKQIAEKYDYEPEIPVNDASKNQAIPKTPAGEQPSWATDEIWNKINNKNPGKADEIVAAIEEQAAILGVHPAAVAGVIDTESGFDPAAKNGSYRGATQIGPAPFRESGGTLGGLTYSEYASADLAAQIHAISDYMNNYNYQKKLGGVIGNASVPMQAAILQGMQFAPNGTTWQRAYYDGNYNVATTNTGQAGYLGNKTLGAMSSYYSGLLGY